MFETAELGRKVSRKAYEEEEPKLHTALLEAQRRVREAGLPVIVIVSGVEGAGKGGIVNLLNRWLDTRGVTTHAFWEASEEERERPRYWRFWRALPPRGTFGILFGSWYTEPIVEHAFRRIDRPAFEREMHRIVQFEELLTHDGALIVKLWFHLTKEGQQEALAEEVGKRIAPPQLLQYAKHFKRFLTVSERALRITDTGVAPWQVIEAGDRRYRELAAGRALLAALEGRLAALAGPARRAGERDGAQRLPPPPPLPIELPNLEGGARTILDQLVQEEKPLSPQSASKALAEQQERLARLAWRAKEKGRNTVLVFEGWDAAGKGGAIRRVTGAIDARLFRVISVAAPTDEERSQHYLWRFWRHLPRAGYVTIYDRSWYGRVLVERVEGYAREVEWRRAYQEINLFEEQLVDNGTVLCKFWLQITPEEQLRRFEERQLIEWKRHKITEEDWRNREKWGAYEEAVHDMVQRTSTPEIPWGLIPANDKRAARIEVVKRVADRLEEEVG